MATRAQDIPAELTGEGTDPTQSQQPSQGGTPSEGTTSQSSQPSPDGGQGTGSEGSQSPFNNPQLRGRTPEEIEQYFDLMQRTIREQGAALNQASQPRREEPVAGTGGGPSNDAYWQDPVGTLQNLIDRSLEPFRQDMRSVRQNTALENLSRELPDFDRYYPMVDATLTQQGVTDRSENILRLTYLALRGQEVIRGTAPPPPMGQGNMNWGNQNQGQGNGQGGPPSPPPQHRPSNTPLPPQNQQNRPVRELTESERTLAKIAGQTPEQYLRWLELSDTEVTESNIGREGSQ